MIFCIQRKGFVQILYNEVRQHWLAVASVSNGIDEPVVNVYDSLFHTASSYEVMPHTYLIMHKQTIKGVLTGMLAGTAVL